MPPSGSRRTEGTLYFRRRVIKTDQNEGKQDRNGHRGTALLSETNLERIEAVIDQEKPQIVVIDSIQTMYREEITSAPGSVSQVRESTGVLMQIAKSCGIAIFVVGHVTKEGVVAGQGYWNI